MKSASPRGRDGTRSAIGPLVLLALVAGGLGAVSRATGTAAPAVGSPRPAATEPRYEVPCPPGQLADDGVCIPVTVPAELLRPDLRANPTPLQPLQGDRPPDYSAYVLPVRSDEPLEVVDADRGDLPHAVRVRAPRGAPIHALHLDGQEGPTEVVFAAHGPPAMVITAHVVQRERGKLLYLLILADLADVPDALLEVMPTAPIQVDEGSLLGKAGPSGFLLALRQVHRDAKLSEAVPDLTPDTAFASDPRNLLPLRR